MRIRYFVGAIFILLGLSALTGIDIGRFIGPLFLIFIGWILLMGKGKHSYKNDHIGKMELSSQNSIEETFVFSGTQKRFDSQNFDGGKITTVFGGADLDISDVKVKKKIINMELVAVFGGIKIKVPKNWEVTSEAVGIIGGIDNRTSGGQKSVELHVKGAAVLGGIELLN